MSSGSLIKEKAYGVAAPQIQKVAGMLAQKGQWKALKHLCDFLAQTLGQGALLTKIQLDICQVLIDQLDELPALDYVENSMTHCCGPFLDFILGDLCFRENKFSKSLEFYSKHIEKYKTDLDYGEKIRKLKIKDNHSSKRTKDSIAMEKREIPSQTAIYTVILGPYDQLIEPLEPGPFDYICFTDQDFQSDIWKIQKVTPQSNLRLQSRELKLLPHKFLSQYSHSLYVDGNFQLQPSISSWLKEVVERSDFSMFAHSLRSDYFQEARCILQLDKGPIEEIVSQTQNYLKRGLQKNGGLFEGGFIWRHHGNKEVADLMEKWWEEFQKYPHRDQLSLAFLLSKVNKGPDSILSKWGDAQGSQFHRKLAHGSPNL